MINSQLTSFICVADSGSFNKAAEKLFISSTAVIKQMNALEKHLELRLFDRTNHGILWTGTFQFLIAFCTSYSQVMISCVFWISFGQYKYHRNASGVFP